MNLVVVEHVRLYKSALAKSDTEILHQKSIGVELLSQLRVTCQVESVALPCHLTSINPSN